MGCSKEIHTIKNINLALKRLVYGLFQVNSHIKEDYLYILFYSISQIHTIYGLF